MSSIIVKIRYHAGGPQSSGGAIFFLYIKQRKKMEPIMSCPQGLTLLGKMCTVAPVLSCPSGYTLVNGMCQQDSGIQGYGESMNIPPSDNRVLATGEVQAQQQTADAAMMMNSPQPAPSQQTYGESLMNLLPNLPGQQAFMGAAETATASARMMGMSPISRPMTNTPQIQPLGTPQPPPLRPMSPQRRQQRMMMGTPIPPPPMSMRSPTPTMTGTMGMMGGAQGMTGTPGMMGGISPPCPMGYSINGSDGMCYPL